mgnify:FL=1
MRTEDFNYDLPEELIAQTPLADRTSSRMLVIRRKTGELFHKHFYDLTDYLKKGDVLVFNDTKVIPARLIGVKDGGTATVEVLLLKRISIDTWEALLKPAKRIPIGGKVIFGDNELTAEVIGIKDDGERIVKFSYDGVFEEILDRLGNMPLPPYIKEKLKDKNRYQTVYAKYDGSAAAPTAGLHFTKEYMRKIREMGVEIAFVTLHVGLGTFRPVSADDISEHKMHTEHYIVTKETADIINKAKAEGRRVICVGTTSLRTLEASAQANGGKVAPGSGDTDIFIFPGYKFLVTDALITNFHLPKSTLIMLVSALYSKEGILKAYNEAVKERYRFFSFGDCCFIE